MTQRIRAFWCRYPSHSNFGDALTPWLIKKFTGHYPDFSWPEDPRKKYFVVGSIIRYAGPNTVVWGSGIIDRTEKVSSAAEILAVRGPFTRQHVHKSGGECPKIYGDPALFVPELYTPKPPPRRYALGIIPHFMEKAMLMASWKAIPGVKMIDIQQSVERVIDVINSCDQVATSALHGLITAHAYGIPATWVKFSNRPHGDGIKFHDYFASINHACEGPFIVDPMSVDPDALIRRAVAPGMDINLKQLWKVCPFRKIT